jgi:hypothetical protein
MKLKRQIFAAFSLALLLPFSSIGAQDFKKWEAKVTEFKRWLDVVGVKGSRLWLRLDSKSRPHRLYVGEGFDAVDEKTKEEFVEIFSHYLAGHPEKFMLIDIFDARTGSQIGEFGWGGFKLFASYLQALKDKNSDPQAAKLER